MNILVSGGSGFIGQSLAQRLVDAGHTVTILDRNPPRRVPDGVRLVLLDLIKEEVRDDVVADHDAVIHLMGVNVFKRWSKRYKQAIYDSRIVTGKKLADAVLRVDGRHRPKIFVSASAIGFYGNTGDTAVDEAAPVGDDFLATLCRDWEAMLDVFKGTNVRTVSIRTGIVIGRGGMLGVLVPLFKAYMGAVIGGGKQFISWIGITDLLRIYQAAVEDEQWMGPVNAVVPTAVTLDELTRDLSEILKRPRIFKIPAFAIKPFFGEFSDVVLFSQKVVPTKLKQWRFRYEQADLKATIAAALAKPTE